MEEGFGKITLGLNLEWIVRETLKDFSLIFKLPKLFRQLFALLQEYKVKIDNLEEKIQALTKKQFIDPLTNLPLYFSLSETNPDLEKRLLNSLNNQRFKDNYSVFFLDVNNFKEINENFGYQKADKILTCLAEALRENKRGVDYVFRRGRGSDEFVGIFNCSSGELLNYFKRVAKSWNKKLRDKCLKSYKNKFSFSVGVVPVAESLLKDKAEESGLISTLEHMASELMKEAKEGKKKGSYIVGLSPINPDHVGSLVRPDFYI